MKLSHSFRPLYIGFARDVPLLPGLLESSVQGIAQLFQSCLPLAPDDIDLSVVCDRLKSDVGHSLVDKAVADVPMHRLRTWYCTSNFGFSLLAFARIGQQIKRIARS